MLLHRRIDAASLLTAIVVFCLALTSFATEHRRQVIVAPDGSGSFTNIAAAVDSIQDATEADPVDIWIKPGTYVETIKTKNWVNLVGEDCETCIVTYSISADKTHETYKYHTIWATSCTTIKNLTLVGGRVKYVIHSDGGRPYVLNIENCTLRRESKDPQVKLGPAFGIGLWANQHIVMKNCHLEAPLPIYWHKHYDQKAGCSMTLETCALKGQDYAIRLGMLGSKQQDFFVIHDSVLEGAKGAILYTNQRNVKGVPWNGQDEARLVGSGNRMGDVTGTTMLDDRARRATGQDLARPPARIDPTDRR